MADTTISLPSRPDAPLLQACLAHLAGVLQKLVDTLGDGTAQPITADALSQIAAPPPTLDSKLVSTYNAQQSQVTQYHTDLGDLDTDVAQISSNSAGIANTVQGDVTSLVDTITPIVTAVPQNPSLQQQLDAVGQIDKLVAAMDTSVQSAHTDFVANANSTGTPSNSTASTTTGGTGIPATAASYSPSSGSAVAQPLSGGETVQAKQIYDYLMTKYGLSSSAAAGILGNMEVESSLDTGSYNSAEGAIGLCQWEGGRRSELEAFAASRGKPVTDWQTQVDFMMSELKGGGYSDAYNALQAAQNSNSAAAASDVAAAFDSYYEKSAGTSHGQRMADAASIFNTLAGTSAA